MSASRRFVHARYAGLLLLVVVLAGCGSRSEDSLTEDAAAVQGSATVPYTVTIAGVEPALEEHLRAVSEAVATSDRPPPSVLALRRRAAGDESRLVQALAGEGYYDAAVDSAVVPASDEALATIAIEVESGPLYRLANVRIEVEGDAPGYTPPTTAELGLVRGEAAIAQAVLDAEADLVAQARAAGYAYAVAEDRLAIIDRDAKTLSVTLRIRPGPPIRFGSTSFTGADGVDEDYLRARIAWSEGDRFTPEVITDSRRAIVDTGLFQVVEINLPETPPVDGVAPIVITTRQRLHRTISGGLRFETDAGPGGDILWEHRNAFGGGELATIRLDLDQLKQSLRARLRAPDLFDDPDRALLLEGAAEREDTDAFESLSITSSLGVEQRFGERLDGTLAFAVDFSDVSDAEGQETFGLVYVPAVLRYDGTNDALDPTRGLRARIQAAPFWDVLNPGLSFQRVVLDGSTYFKLTDSPRLVLALRGALGSLVGADRSAIPANRRFYAGGGGSIRGIPFQAASPLDDNDEPLGGRSLLEVAGELRYNITDEIGVVGFVDAGRAFEASFPDFDEPLILGAGVGVRYYTPIGPLRVDVAVPVDRRRVDDPFQFYISLGQAF